MHDRYAFSLTELLVAIVIIAILIAILVPALASARDSARQVECAAQLRHYGVATEAYRLDFADLLPLAPESMDPEPLVGSSRYLRLQDIFENYMELPGLTVGDDGISFSHTRPYHCPAHVPNGRPNVMSSYAYRPGYFIWRPIPFEPARRQRFVSQVYRNEPIARTYWEDVFRVHPGSSDVASAAGSGLRQGAYNDGSVRSVDEPQSWGRPGTHPSLFPVDPAGASE